ncbi:MAG: M23 family metallopeptidase, partial [Muribaculaceae bacterium]|nr:M23 family metallopeptidase [Muribaculaceae bacterium]
KPAAKDKKEKDTKVPAPKKVETAQAKSKDSKSESYASARHRKNHNDKSDGNKPAKSAAPASKATSSASSSASSAHGNFEKMKGQLPRPVSGAFRVISPFGRHPYPCLPDVMYDNLGIDVEVSPGAQVKAVYGGKVSAVFIMPDYQTVVMVNHGNYVTVYGHISTANVKSGDSVTQGQVLGSLVKDGDGGKHSTLHFEVWKNRETQNPMNWIK